MPAIDTSALTSTQKIALMETLWSELSDEASTPPRWHHDVLESRQKEWEQREKLAQDWNVAKNELRKELVG
jgi:hypothetical protein